MTLPRREYLVGGRLSEEHQAVPVIYQFSAMVTAFIHII